MNTVKLSVIAITTAMLAACGGGGGGGTTTPPPSPLTCPTASSGNIMIGGTITYDRVPHDATTSGLDYTNTFQAAARGVTVEVLNSSNDSVINTASTSVTGYYCLEAPQNLNVYIRVRAELLTSGTNSWHFSVLDNTNANAMYVMDGSHSLTGTTDEIRNLNAPSGWGGTSYTTTRSAAPFAIIDTVYSGVQFVLGASAGTNFPSLNLYWSTLNNDTTPDVTLGQIGTSHYDPATGAIYLLGDDDNDTDEYDASVIAHEWGHYLEDKFSRTDNIGGPHFVDDHLDMRVAFGEGFGNAFAQMVLNDPVYRDSNSAAQALGFSFNVENEIATYPGWYSETSIEKILYDLYDSSNDAADSDTLSMGFAPIWDVLVNEQRTQPVFTSIYKFITALKTRNPTDATAITNLVTAQNIHVVDVYGSSESNNAGNTYVTPIFFNLALGNNTGICVTRAFALLRGLGQLDYNVLGINHVLRFTPGATGNYQFTVTGGAYSDPDAIFYTDAGPNYHDIATSITETFTENALVAGREYMLEVYDYNLLADPTVPVNNQCYTVNVTAL